MRTSRTARKIVAGVSAAVVSVVLVGGTVAATSSDDAGRGINAKSAPGPELGRGIG